MFTKLLIANRGEIAVRIIRACKEMGIRTVAVYSKADAESIHVALADEAICIGEAAAKDSYLNQERIISAAIASKAQAIHPGYGFLAENASFAKLCKKYGIAFVGPSGELIDRMGDKDAARRLMKASGVPIIPGSGILENVDEAKKAAKEIGYPVMLKASAGGGGLFDMYGNVIGIIDYKLVSNTSASIDNIGFAITINEAKPVINDLMTKGYVTNRPGLGINGEEISEYSAYMQGLESGGVYVTYISEDMPVAKSGLKVGDIISKVNGTAVTSVTDIQNIIAELNIGDTVELTVYRAGATGRYTTKTINVELAEIELS